MAEILGNGHQRMEDGIERDRIDLDIAVILAESVDIEAQPVAPPGRFESDLPGRQAFRPERLQHDIIEIEAASAVALGKFGIGVERVGPAIVDRRARIEAEVRFVLAIGGDRLDAGLVGDVPGHGQGVAEIFEIVLERQIDRTPGLTNAVRLQRRRVRDAGEILRRIVMARTGAAQYPATP